MFTELTKDVIGYKCITDKNTKRKFLVTLFIPKGTRVYSSGFDRRCKASPNSFQKHKLRAYSVEVLEIRQIDNTQRYNRKLTKKTVDKVVHYSPHASRFDDNLMYTKYEVGEEVIAPNWSDYDRACAGGIHFFVDKQRALEW